jgi:CubicO group peptidase (beta-lactamase class C family)
MTTLASHEHDEPEQELKGTNLSKRRCNMLGTTSGTLVQGHVEDGWGKVADAFRANFEGTPARSARHAASTRRPPCRQPVGRPRRPRGEDIIALVASTTKGATAICTHLLEQRGELDLDARGRVLA